MQLLIFECHARLQLFDAVLSIHECGVEHGHLLAAMNIFLNEDGSALKVIDFRKARKHVCKYKPLSASPLEGEWSLTSPDDMGCDEMSELRAWLLMLPERMLSIGTLHANSLISREYSTGKDQCRIEGVRGSSRVFCPVVLPAHVGAFRAPNRRPLLQVLPHMPLGHCLSNHTFPKKCSLGEERGQRSDRQ